MTLDSLGCLCSTMFRVSPNHLLWVLEGLLDGEVHNHIVVPEPTKHWAKVAFDRMLFDIKCERSLRGRCRDRALSDYTLPN